MALYGSTIPTDHGEFVVTFICPNRGSAEALKIAADQITPSAFEPGIPERTAKQMQRDGIVATAPPSTEGMEQVGVYKGIPVWADREFPPPCDGHHATEAPMPPFVAQRLDGKDDDEGDLVGENYGGSD